MKWCVRQIPYIIKANDINCFIDVPAKEHQVNVFDYHPDKLGYDLYQGNPCNLGDSLGGVIIDFLLSKERLDKNKWISSKKHLFTVGSNITGGELRGNYQDATIWGSGILKEPSQREVMFQKLSRRKLDVRAVRGPLTRNALIRLGHRCPEIYGDPAILMPMIYQPNVKKQYDYSIVLQFWHERKFREDHPNERMISMNTDDYKSVIDDIVSSKVIYTSSLHGIILAEAYGVPAIFFRGLGKDIDFKYYDYYYSTGRKDIHIAETFEEALTMEPLPLPDLKKMQQDLLDTFPYDLWEC
jgi:pyruvyltransferase